MGLLQYYYWLHFEYLSNTSVVQNTGNTIAIVFCAALPLTRGHDNSLSILPHLTINVTFQILFRISFVATCTSLEYIEIEN